MLRLGRLVIILLVVFLSSMTAQDSEIEIGIDEKLGDYIPLDVEFINSEGDTVSFAELIDKPVLLALVYYECPDICSPLLAELAWVVEKVDLVPNEDFEVITLSFDHRETTKLAEKWKRTYFQSFKKPFPEDAWSFLTGDSTTIKRVTDAVGFYFKPTSDSMYLHAGALITLSPKGKISRYIFGSQYNQFDIKMALLDAEAGKTNPTISKVLQFCFSYDPEGRAYTLNITRIIGTIMLLAVGIFLTVLIVKKKKEEKNEDKEFE
ncbi:MAG: SCO family protein [Melioribacteraceae bacterium]|nr:SCO family protein [Melioribacteraceae bacterium]MCF8354410.1 SCO family protein [Melioribacteraceae bacterium]MCF8392993.1 SCO family protein [Melioribacteraceae bacterium]MCF8417264.1 SCO family protein [Melioribacteraceae bacterium]